ncbi:MAG: threonylcarbamoyl-AMP synthase [Acidobacteria bacterium]|nr:MAG: threonylcarbamoyl-AMP synthase [Acidobacteriota bacterium]
MSEILKVDKAHLEYVLEYSVRLILAGKVVAFPTDTFYALGADPFNLAAVTEVFRIKGRSFDRPLPLLVASLDQASDLTSDPPALFFKLAEKFWPGPLTLVVPASRQIPLKVTGNTGKVGLIEAAARPLTGTSANLAEHPACQTADEVEKQVGGRLPLILDAGAAHGGLASTVVELVGERGRILRSGPVTEDQLKEFLA